MKKELVWVTALFLTVTAIFFYQTILFGKVPFPGDGLMSDFQPWRSASYMGYAPGGVPNKAQYPDTYRQIYPWKTLAISELKQGKLPLWNPYNFSGSPLLANFQSAALYPLGIIYLFISQITAWTILVLLQPLLAGLFTYWYMRKIGAKTYGATLAALSYGFSGFMAVWLEYNTVGHVILWLPLILLAIESLRQKPKPVWFAILAFSNAAALLAGHPQVYGYVAICSVAYAIFRLPKKLWIPSAVFMLLGIGVTGLQLIPGIELISNAARSRHEFTNLFTKILIQPWQLIAMAFPNIFGNPATRTYWPTDTFVGKVTTIGLVPLFFLPSALRCKDAATKWHIWATLTVLVLITANPITYVLYQLPIPLITSSSPSLMAFLLAFSLSVSCGMGLDYWMTDKHSLKKLLMRSIQVLLLCGGLALVAKLPIFTDFHAHAGIAYRAIAYGAGIAGITLTLFWIAVAFTKYRKLAIVFILILHTADLWIFFGRFNPFVPETFVFPNHKVLTYLTSHAPDRYWGYGTAGIAANFGTQYRMFSPEGYDPLYPKWYGELLYAYKNGNILTQFTNSTRSDAAISAGFGNKGLSDAKTLRMMDLLSVRYILDRTENGSTQETFPSTRYQSSMNTDDWHIFTNLNAAPRAFLANEVWTYKDVNDFSSKLFSQSFNPTKMVLVPSFPVGIQSSSASGSAVITSYTPESITIKTVRSVPSVLILTDTYYPGWKATVDGNSVNILKANWAFRAVIVPGGTHTVVMTYAPDSVALGKILSIISIGGIVAGLFILKRKKYV